MRNEYDEELAFFGLLHRVIYGAQHVVARRYLFSKMVIVNDAPCRQLSI